MRSKIPCQSTSSTTRKPKRSRRQIAQNQNHIHRNRSHSHSYPNRNIHLWFRVVVVAVMILTTTAFSLATRSFSHSTSFGTRVGLSRSLGLGWDFLPLVPLRRRRHGRCQWDRQRCCSISSSVSSISSSTVLESSSSSSDGNTLISSPEVEGQVKVPRKFVPFPFEVRHAGTLFSGFISAFVMLKAWCF